MKLAIAGSSGQMGRTLIEAALETDDLSIAVALDRPDSPELGRDCAEFLGRPCGVRITSDLAALRDADVLIDFTRPAGTLVHVEVCAAAGVKAVIGTTGFDEAGRRAIEAAAKTTAIVFAPNMSVGVNATFQLVELAARLLSDYDVEIIEAHHRHKVDAPSGTALAFGEAVARAQSSDLGARAVYARQGHVGPRREASIGFSAIRGGDIVGDHTVMFAGTGERIEITHRSNSRKTYALGSLRAARFLSSRASGLFGMHDVLAA